MIFKEKYCTGVFGQKRGQNEFSVFYNKSTDFLHEVATAYRLKSFWQNQRVVVGGGGGSDLVSFIWDETILISSELKLSFFFKICGVIF